MTKKEFSILYFLEEEIKEFGPYTIKRESIPHYGLRHFVYTDVTVYHKKKPVLYLDFTYQFHFRKIIKLRDVIECNRNVYTILETDDLDNELLNILGMLDITHYDDALLEDFTIEDILDDNCIQFSEYTLLKLEKYIRKMNNRFDGKVKLRI